jgi:hypothetical protein
MLGEDVSRAPFQAGQQRGTVFEYELSAPLLWSEMKSHHSGSTPPL